MCKHLHKNGLFCNFVDSKIVIRYTKRLEKVQEVAHFTKINV